jgi:hypothetical protein
VISSAELEATESEIIGLVLNAAVAQAITAPNSHDPKPGPPTAGALIASPPPPPPAAGHPAPRGATGRRQGRAPAGAAGGEGTAAERPAAVAPKPVLVFEADDDWGDGSDGGGGGGGGGDGVGVGGDGGAPAATSAPAPAAAAAAAAQAELEERLRAVERQVGICGAPRPKRRYIGAVGTGVRGPGSGGRG